MVAGWLDGGVAVGVFCGKQVVCVLKLYIWGGVVYCHGNHVMILTDTKREIFDASGSG